MRFFCGENKESGTIIYLIALINSFGIVHFALVSLQRHISNVTKLASIFHRVISKKSLQKFDVKTVRTESWQVLTKVSWKWCDGRFISYPTLRRSSNFIRYIETRPAVTVDRTFIKEKYWFLFMRFNLTLEQRILGQSWPKYTKHINV